MIVLLTIIMILVTINIVLTTPGRITSSHHLHRTAVCVYDWVRARCEVNAQAVGIDTFGGAPLKTPPLVT